MREWRSRLSESNRRPTHYQCDPGARLTSAYAVDRPPDQRFSHPVVATVQPRKQQSGPAGCVNTGRTPAGEAAPLFIEGNFEVCRPAGTPSGFLPEQSLPINIAAGLPLDRGVYEWRLEIYGHHEEAWSATLFVRGPAPIPQPG
jgi:hypothetical protein